MVSPVRRASSSTALIADAASAPGYGSHGHTKPVDSLNDVSSESNGESFDAVPREKRQIGTFDAISLTFNRMIGTGIYATPSLILRASGSVGMSLVMWILGALVASAGMAVYVEFGTGLPRSGAEKNYLEYVYRRPKLLVTCCYAMFTCLLGWSSANSVVFGEYLIRTCGGETTRWNARLYGLAALSAVTLLHIFHSKWGLRLQGSLAVIKIMGLAFIVVTGLFVLVGLIPLRDKPNNFDNFWQGTSHDPNALVLALYYVIWSFIGYSNVHYALSETKDPVNTVKRAAPFAMFSITALYFLVNIAYLVVVPKNDIRDGGLVVAAYFFRILFGATAERVLSFIICLTILGNISSVSFTQGRVIQELGREGILPYTAIFASNAPYNTPLAALTLQWVMSTIYMLSPPPGDAYNFVLNLHSYPYSIINIFVSAGLLWLYFSPRGKTDWHPPYRAGIPVVAAFLVSNAFLAIVPAIPPSPGFSVFVHLPYWLHVACTFGILVVGIVYWYIWARFLPARGGYRLVQEIVVQKDGVSRSVLKKVR